MFSTRREYKDVTAYIEKEDATGCTALFNAAAEGNEMTIKTLLAAKANVCSSDKDGWTPMHIAAANGHTSVITILFQHDEGSLEWPDNEGRTPLQRACYYGRKGAAELLLNYKADIESQDDKGKTPFHAAVAAFLIAMLLDYLWPEEQSLRPRQTLVGHHCTVHHAMAILKQ